MRTPTLLFAAIAGSLLVAGALRSTAASQRASLQTGTLCAKTERVIFSCPIKRSAKIVSLCASKDLASDRGYVQYRFGLPEKIELEFPKERTGTQQKFQYSHYFRAQVDMTEIGFNINGYQYQITDDYNGEEKPAQTVQGVIVTAPGKPKDVSLSCSIKPKADYADLQTAMPNAQ
jgi:outer membrane murein-binding lipoprotein Lpp